MNKEDFEISKMSFTSKDFPSIYPEVLQIAETLTNKWTPTQSNESDPGVVLLKEAAFVADHNNYNIDKNILENFLPSATQDRSVRDICEMNGYTPRYYVSATGEVRVRYRNTTGEGMPTNENGVGVVIPRFTLVISTDDESISYTQVTDLTLAGDSNEDLVGTALFMQGILQTLSVNGTGVINLSNLDDNNRLYLPEYMVAQNGIFITSADNGYEWERDNYLLTKPSGSRVYKVDYDSYNGLPYIEFPSDIASLIGSGLYIRYISTLGEAGNVDANSLVKIISPTEYIDYTRPDDDHTWSMENVTCSNGYGIMTGKDPETIDQMYKSFMKTVGTFDTLVTCLDYSNYIYNIEDDFGRNLVSNAYVTDRRTDYNNALNVISYDLNGEYFDNISLKSNSIRYVGCGSTLPTSGNLGDMFFLLQKVDYADPRGIIYIYDLTGWREASTISINDFTYLTTSMTPYDLSIYALKVFSLMDYNPFVPQQALEESFKPVSDSTLSEIKSYLEDSKNICHTYKDSTLDDIFTFKNYAPLRVSIIPYNKVTKAERNEILNNIFIELSKNFNPRNIEFGDELNREELKKTIIGADSRIKDITLDFDYYMKAMTKAGLEYSMDNQDIFMDSTILVDLIAKNVLAGRVCLFDFEDRFKFEYGQSDATIFTDISAIRTEAPIAVNSEGWEQSDELTWTVSTSINSHADAKYKYKYTLNLNNENDGAAFNNYELSDNDSLVIQQIDRNTNKVVSVNTYTTQGEIGYSFRLDPTDSVLTNSRGETFYDLQNCVLQLGKTTRYASTGVGTINVNDYVIKDNETVQIIYPNYYSTETYGTYVLYRYHDEMSSPAVTIRANQEHVLTCPMYFKYTKDGITKTETINVGETIKADFDIFDTDTVSNTMYKDGEHPGKYASLSSNQTISKREKMKTILNNTSLMCYWIIKSSKTGTNLLFDPGETEKILGENDYFIYADEALNEIIILGAGTKIDRDANDTRDWLLENNNYSIDSISNNGVNSDIPWKRMSFNNYNLTITEMTIISLGSGDILNISGWSFSTDEIDANTVKIDNDWKYCTATIAYTVNGTKTILPKIPKYYLIRSRLDLSMNADYPQTLYGDQKIIISTSTGDQVIDGSDTHDDQYRKVQCSTTLVATGGDYVDLSIYELNDTDINMFSYITGKEKVVVAQGSGWREFNSKVISIPTNEGLRKHIFPFWFRNENNSSYPNTPSAYIIPIYVENEALEVTVYATVGKPATGYYENDNLVEFEDFNSDPLTPAIDDPNKAGHYKYFLTGSKRYYLVPKGYVKNTGAADGETVGSPQIIPDGSELYLTIRWSPKYNNDHPFSSINPSCVVVDDPVVVNGLNKKLSTSISTEFANNQLLNRIKNLIARSDNPNIKPNYVYDLDPSMEIDLDRYLLVDAISGEYSSLAFDNPLILFDNNNVAHDMSIAEVDIANSNIDITRDMRNY